MKNNGDYRTSAQETNSLCYSKFSKLLYYIKTDQTSGIVNAPNGWLLIRATWARQLNVLFMSVWNLLGLLIICLLR